MGGGGGGALWSCVYVNSEIVRFFSQEVGQVSRAAKPDYRNPPEVYP